MEIKEIWKTIEGYENYQVSSFGRVKSLKYDKERILKQEKINNGYCCVGLCKDGKKKRYLVHRLVASAFLDNPNNYPCVNHKNEVKTENCVSNLEFCSHTYNNNYGMHNERIAKAHQKPIACYNKKGDLVALYTSIKQASELLNINHCNISSCCKGKYKSCGGYIFKYIKKAG